MTEQHASLLRIVVQGILALVLVCGMIWIVLSPSTSDEASKAALVVVSSAAGFLFGKHT